MLAPRTATIMRAIVREYVRTGQPVASKSLAERYPLKVSPATVRNDMALLEEHGYIARPHTSAGRIPTDQGYRWFVDNWPAPAWPSLPVREQQAIAGAFRTDFGGLEDMLDATSQVLSELTEEVALVSAPPSRRNLLRRIELLARDPRRATLLLIADTGVVEQGVVEFEQDRTEEELAELAATLQNELAGVAFEDVGARIQAGPPAAAGRAAVAREVGRLLAQRDRDRVYRGGTANIISPEKFADIGTAHIVVEVLEHPPVLARLLEAARASDSTLVLIGQENPIQEMRTCAAIFAPYELGSDRRGTVGVIGPTRMDYPHVISAVGEVARWLSGLLDSFGR